MRPLKAAAAAAGPAPFGPFARATRQIDEFVLFLSLSCGASQPQPRLKAPRQFALNRRPAQAQSGRVTPRSKPIILSSINCFVLLYYHCGSELTMRLFSRRLRVGAPRAGPHVAADQARSCIRWPLPAAQTNRPSNRDTHTHKRSAGLWSLEPIGLVCGFTAQLEAGESSASSEGLCGEAWPVGGE